MLPNLGISIPSNQFLNISTMNIPISKLSRTRNKSKYIDEVFKNICLTTTSKRLKFEQSFVQYVDSQYSHAINSCNEALHYAVKSAGIGSGDEVLVPTHTFTSSVDVLLEIGADPVFFDVECNTGLVTPSILIKVLKDHPNVKAIILVDFKMQTEQMKVHGNEGVLDLCKKYNLKIIKEAENNFQKMIGDQITGVSFGETINLIL